MADPKLTPAQIGGIKDLLGKNDVVIVYWAHDISNFHGIYAVIKVYPLGVEREVKYVVTGYDLQSRIVRDETWGEGSLWGKKYEEDLAHTDTSWALDELADAPYRYYYVVRKETHA